MKQVTIGNPLMIGDVTLIPVEKVSVSHWRQGARLCFFGNKQVVCIVALSPGARKAFRITGEEVPLDQLASELPEIKEALERV